MDRVKAELRAGYRQLTGDLPVPLPVLGNAFGSLHQPPYIHLDGDDRTGAVASSENLTVNLDHTQDFGASLCS